MVSFIKSRGVTPKPVHEEANLESLSDLQRWERLSSLVEGQMETALHLNASHSGSKSHLCHSGKLLIESALVGEDGAKGVLLLLLLFLIY